MDMCRNQAGRHYVTVDHMDTSICRYKAGRHYAAVYRIYIPLEQLGAQSNAVASMFASRLSGHGLFSAWKIFKIKLACALRSTQPKFASCWDFERADVIMSKNIIAHEVLNGLYKQGCQHHIPNVIKSWKGILFTYIRTDGEQRGIVDS